MCIISPSSVLIKKELFYKYGMFQTWLKVCEDYELWLRLTSKVNIYLVDEPCVIKYGGHTDQLSKKFWGMDRFRVLALEKLIDRYELSKPQKLQTIKVLLKKIKIILAGAKNRNNYKMLKIYKYKRYYWEKEMKKINE